MQKRTRTPVPHIVKLTSSQGRLTLLSVVKKGPEVYELVGAEGVPSLDGYTLAFELENLPPDFVNLDTKSDSYSCFGRSEHLSSSGLVIKGAMFQVGSLRELKLGMSKLRGRLLDNAEF
jgi:hypothetical protein